MGEVPAFAVADSVGSGADAGSRVLLIIRYKSVGTAPATWFGNVTDGRAVVRVLALLLVWLALDLGTTTEL